MDKNIDILGLLTEKKRLDSVVDQLIEKISGLPHIGTHSYDTDELYRGIVYNWLVENSISIPKYEEEIVDKELDDLLNEALDEAFDEFLANPTPPDDVTWYIKDIQDNGWVSGYKVTNMYLEKYGDSDIMSSFTYSLHDTAQSKCFELNEKDEKQRDYKIWAKKSGVKYELS